MSVQTAGLHPDEDSRLDALADLQILDTAAEARYDRLTSLAATVLDVPIAMVSIVDRDRQWFKSSIGVGVCETPRDIAFCAHAIVVEDDGPFVVEDTWADARFADNPLVTGDPGIRFYAGQALRGQNGLPVGTLCVIDHTPRILDARQLQALRDIAGLVEIEFFRRTEEELVAALRRSEETARVSLDSLDQGVVLGDPFGTVHRINPAAERILGLTGPELTARWNSSGWGVDDEDGKPLTFSALPVVRAAASGEPIFGQIVGWQRPDGERILLRMSCIPNADNAGGLVLAFTDITTERMAQRLLDTTLEVAPVGLAVLDVDRTILRCNQTFADQAGRPADELLGTDVAELVHPDDRATATDVGRAIRRGGILTRELDQRVLRPDGGEMWVNTRIAVIPDAGRPRAIAATFDVTERRHMLSQLSRFRHLFQSANDMISVIDASGRILYASPSTQRILGFPEGTRLPGGVLSLVHPDDLGTSTAELAALVSDGTRGTDPFTVRVMSFSGEIRHIECVGVNLLDEPAVCGVVITARDVTERIELTQQLAHSALHDTLTGLANRRLLETTLEASLARGRRDGTLIALCFIDLDGFKRINDTAGHAGGDRLIVAVADSIRRAIRTNDLAARVGGDEFVVILDAVDGIAQALVIARRLDELLAGTFTGPGIGCGASIGLALSRPDDTVSSLLNRADSAMYRAKSRTDSSIEVAATDEPLPWADSAEVPVP